MTPLALTIIVGSVILVWVLLIIWNTPKAAVDRIDRPTPGDAAEHAALAIIAELRARQRSRAIGSPHWWYRPRWLWDRRHRQCTCLCQRDVHSSCGPCWCGR